MGDAETIEKILKSKDKTLRSSMRKFMDCENYYTGEALPSRKYYHAVENYTAKHRYLDPLVCSEFKIALRQSDPQKTVIRTHFTRLSARSKKIKSYIRRTKNYHTEKYAWVNFKI